MSSSEPDGEDDRERKEPELVGRAEWVAAGERMERFAIFAERAKEGGLLIYFLVEMAIVPL